ncbi:hypothetical protein OB955_01575 [Halobacteria archaeon AArc-m2/3/4]|uniref:Uncharacterized protein n=1 Tax=Natronoglomus mannanivorans TaxID=2979990 RepID=A0ABT2Q934_9EURY|nr:hypothetical protein [Halobacteria archaeon AArc-m2/3/4]
MDFEAPVDAWYVYVATAIISVALAGLALGVSTGPPPDAPQASNTIEGATGSEYTASAFYDHDADVVTIDRRTITMENEHGTTHSSLSYGVVVPVNGHERLENLVYGSSFDDEYGDELADPNTHAFETFTEEVEDAFDDNTGEPLAADGELRARQIVVDAGIDELEPLTEEAEVEVTETASLPGEPRIRGENVREVELRYEGLEDRAVEFSVEGEYAGWGSYDEDDGETFEDGSGAIQLEINSGTANQPAAEPVEFDVEFAEDGELTAETWASDDLEIGDVQTWDNEIEREVEFDHDHPILGLNDGGNYYVTLVIV